MQSQKGSCSLTNVVNDGKNYVRQVESKQGAIYPATVANTCYKSLDFTNAVSNRVRCFLFADYKLSTQAKGLIF